MLGRKRHPNSKKISTGLGGMGDNREKYDKYKNHYASKGHLNGEPERYSRPDMGVTMLPGDGDGHYYEIPRWEVESALDRMVMAMLEPGTF
jgi:hypothetical protein